MLKGAALRFHSSSPIGITNLWPLLGRRPLFPSAQSQIIAPSVPLLSRPYHDERTHFGAPRQPRRDLYEYEEDGEGSYSHGNGPHEQWRHQSVWRDWLYGHRKHLWRGAAVIAGIGTYYWYHLESAPITGRRRFMSMNETQESQLAEMSLHQVIEQYRGSILPRTHPAVHHVERVARRIISAIDPSLVTPGARWRVFVIEAPTANAFVLPSGDIFVFTGLLPIAGSEAGLAAIIGHEVAHKVARHGAEKMSFYHLFSLASTLVQIFITGGADWGLGPLSGVLQNLFLFLPFSRKCEVEADYIGLLLMARACYDPHEAMGVWERMQKSSQGRDVPVFISTHPSHERRIEKIQTWMSEARHAYEEAGCSEKLLDELRLFRRL